MNFSIDGLRSARFGACHAFAAFLLIFTCAVFASLWTAQPALAQSAPSITAQPSSATISVGANTSFSAAVANATSYQWEVNDGSGFTDIANGGVYSGATTTTLTITGATAGMNGYLYRLVATGSTAPAATSNIAALTVNSPPSIVSQPSAATASVGANASFSATAANATSYQWQVDQGFGFMNVADGGVYSGATTTTLTITGATPAMNGYLYRLIATGSTGPAAASNAATLTVNSPPSIVTQPSAATASVGSNASFSATAANATSYQWQVDQGFGFMNVADGGVYSGATTTMLTITGATAEMSGYRYRLVAADSTSPNAYSDSATLTVQSSDSTLANLSLDAGTLSPAFASGTRSYTATVATDVWSLTIVPTANQANATITVNGASVSSGAGRHVSLAIGPNSIAIVVTAQDWSTTTYWLVVTRTAPPRPTISSISPNTGPSEGNATVTITGTNLTGATGVSFGGSAATIIANSATSITAVTPAHAAGTVDVIVTTAGGTATLTNGYAYDVASGIVLVPAPGPLPAGTVGTVYSQTITAANGTAPYSFAITANKLPDGLSLSSAGVLSGTPTASGSFVFTVTATDDLEAIGSAVYSIAISDLRPIAGPVSATVPANSSANVIAPDITGGTATSVQVGGASQGMATISGTSILYTPNPGFFGTDNFTYTATNAQGSSSASVTVTVSPPTLAFTPSAGALAGGMVGTAYRQTITVAGGVAPYGYAVSPNSLPAGLSLDPTTGAITGTPTASGSFGFTISATDSYGARGTVNYSLAVAPPPAPFTFTPSGGAMAEAMAGEDYRQGISAEGGTGALVYRIASGALPAGMAFNISTGELTGPLAEQTEGDYAFTVEVRDGTGSTGTANFTLKVKARTVFVADRVIEVPAGSTPNDVYLNEGATGGPFGSAEIAFVEPANAGTATIIRGRLAQAGPAAAPAGWYLQFRPNPAYSGQARVGYRLTSAIGASNVGTVTYKLGFAADEVARDIDAKVRGFVQSRQGMIASNIEVPGLLERRRMGGAADAVTTQMSPSQSGLALGFATSLAQMQAAGTGGNAVLPPFNIWVDGALLAHNRRQNDVENGPRGDSRWGTFAMVSLGADYLLSEKALFGLSFHYDRTTDPTDLDARLTGNGWLAGPYASLEIGNGVFWDTSLLYGGSSNDIDTAFWDGTFDTKRWFLDSAIKGQWRLDNTTVLTPKLRAVYFSEQVGDYAVSNGSGDVIELDGFSQEQFRVSLGAEIARSFVLASGATLTPKLGLTGGFSGLDGSGLFGSVSTGLSLQTVNDWTIDAGLLFDIEGEGEKAIGAKLGLSTRF